MADCCSWGNEHSAHKIQEISSLPERLLVFRGFLCFLLTCTIIPLFIWHSVYFPLLWIRSRNLRLYKTLNNDNKFKFRRLCLIRGL